MGRRWLREGAGKQAAMSWSAARGKILGAVKNSTEACQPLVQEVGMLLKEG